jgi:hypothetical protein
MSLYYTLITLKHAENVKGLIIMKINRVWAMANKHTFLIKPIKKLLEAYETSLWIDPFAGYNSVCKITNDINVNAPTLFHLMALDFIKKFDKITGCIFDPPYTLEQTKRSYESNGLNFKKYESQNSVRWTDERNELSKRLIDKGYVISFGYTSTCMGKKRGFNIEQILLVSHGPAHYDTICTVERKI